MEQANIGFNDLVGVLRRRKMAFLITLGALLLLTLLITFMLPSVYRSTATILIEQQEIPSELVSSTVTGYADQQIQVISQRVMTSTNLLEIIDKHELYLDDRDRVPRSELVEMAREDINIDLVSANVVDPRSGRATQATIAFTVSFDEERPNVAQQVANELVSLFLNENLRIRNDAARETEEFFAREAQKLNREIQDLEDEIARFKQENEGALPHLYNLNVQLMQRSETDILETDRQLRSLEERRIYLESELARMDPNSSLRLPSGETVLSPSDQLKALRSQHSSLLALYGENHPDVTRLKRQIDGLETQVGGSASGGSDLSRQLDAYRQELVGARERYTDDHPEVQRLERLVAGLEDQIAAPPVSTGTMMVVPNNRVSSSVTVRQGPTTEAPDVGRLYRGQSAEYIGEDSSWYQIRMADGGSGYVSREFADLRSPGAEGSAPTPVTASNPAYIQLQAQYKQAESEMRSLFAKRQVLQQKLASLEASLARSPLVEATFSTLTRDLDGLRIKYREVKAKEMESRLARSVEQGRKGEKFEMIEPPIAPASPHSPNRVALLFLGLVISIAGALGIVAIAESMDDAVRGTDNVSMILGAAPLAVIPYIATHRSGAVNSRRKLMIGVGVAAGIAVALLIVHLFFGPLDVIWFKFLRKMGT